MFNALTESIITSPYEFLNFKFYGDEKYDLKEERINLLQCVLTPNMEEYANVKMELDNLKVKKRNAEKYQLQVQNVNENFFNLLNNLIQKCIDANLCDKSVLSEEPDLKNEIC